jgi:MFS family permease
VAAVRPVARHAQLLGRAPGFRLLFLAAFASGLGTWVAVVALTVDVFDRTHSAKWVSALLIADFLPAVAIGLTLGPLVDRVSRKLLMVGADVVRLAVFVALPFTDSASRIVVLAAVAGFATGFFRPASYAGLPNLVEEGDLADANSLMRIVESLTMMAGTLAGGAIAAGWGPHPAYWINAASFAASAILLFGLPGRALQQGAAPSRGHLRDIGDGFRLVRSSRALLAVFYAWNLIMISNGFVNVAEIALAKVSYNSGSFGFGLLWTASGIGAVVGSLFATGSLEKRGLATVYGGSLALMAFGAGAAAASPTVWVAVWCFAVLGIGNGAAIVYNALLVQRGSPDHLRGRAFTVLMSSTFAVLGLGMVAAGPFTDAVGARWVYAAAAAVSTIAAVVGHALARGLEVEERKPATALS